MHAQIAAVHPAVAAAMTHVDRDSEPRLERILSRCAPRPAFVGSDSSTGLTLRLCGVARLPYVDPEQASPEVREALEALPR